MPGLAFIADFFGAISDLFGTLDFFTGNAYYAAIAAQESIDGGGVLGFIPLARPSQRP